MGPDTDVQTETKFVGNSLYGTIRELETLLGQTFFDHQLDALRGWLASTSSRHCVYHPPGKGKSKLMAAMLKGIGTQHMLVVAPPVTAAAWQAVATQLGMTCEVISHAKFRMKGTKFSSTSGAVVADKPDAPPRHWGVIVDEYHLLGGAQGKGFEKMKALAAKVGDRIPIIIGSATPQYNDAERCYCINKIVNPRLTMQGYKDWVLQHCMVENNPFSSMPTVLGLRDYDSAEDFLASQPNISYIPDDMDYEIKDILIEGSAWTPEDRELGRDAGMGRMVSSIMEANTRASTYARLQYGSKDVRPKVLEDMARLIRDSKTPVMVFCNREKILKKVYTSLLAEGFSVIPVSGKLTQKAKLSQVEAFKVGHTDVLLGTSTIATGGDGLDQVCDTMIIFDDVTDDALRRQLVGRILPRGMSQADPEALARKNIYRFVDAEA